MKWGKTFFGLLMAGCLPGLFLGQSQAQPIRTMTADVAVIGAGASGLVAGLTAAEGGARVIIFEKMPYPLRTR